MALGNKGFADDLAATTTSGVAEGRRFPRTGILGARENRIAELAAGKVVSKVHELVDPRRCRIWDKHNRDYQALDQNACADLIESFKAQGRQEVPAIVRRVKDDPEHDFEVICGARRHWTVTWLRSHEMPQMTYLIEVRELADEEAFRLADLENRQRKDLSDLERAVDYARAIELYYEGSQQRMADRLEVTKSWLSRYLELAKLPPEVIGAFGSRHIIGISHAAALAPKLRDSATRDSILEEACALGAEQASLRAEGKSYIPPSAVVTRLERLQQRKPGSVARQEATLIDEGGKVSAKATQKPNGSLTIEFGPTMTVSRTAMVAGLKKLLDQMADKNRV